MRPPAHVFEQIVSKPRLDSYKGYWKVDADGAVGLYMWNGEVCSAMSQLLSYFEVTLRNNIHRAMSESASGGTNSSNHWWDTVWSQLTCEARDKIIKVRSDTTSSVPSADEIVSRLSFGFWPNMLSWIGKNRLGLLARIFPAHSLTKSHHHNWNTKASRRAALNSIFELKDVRNRIAHHEPLWKFPKITDTSTYPATLVAAPSTSEATTITRFTRLLHIYDSTVAAMSPDLSAHIRASSWRRQLDFLLSERGRSRYKAGLHVLCDTPIAALALDQQFASVIQSNQPIKVQGAGGEGVFLPV